MAFAWIPAMESVTLDLLRDKVRSQPRKLAAARALARFIVNQLAETDEDEADSSDELVEEIRAVRQRFPADPDLAQSHAMALANASREAISDEIFEADNLRLQELRAVVSSAEWQSENASGFDIFIMGKQYLGLLRRRRYVAAEVQLADMSAIGFNGTSRERLEWLIALRYGFWILLEQGEMTRVEAQIDRVREFMRSHPDDTYEAPHALLAMLLVTFEVAERQGDIALADLRFEEACSLGGAASDWYGHAERLHSHFVGGTLGKAERAAGFADRLSAIWQIKN